MNSLSAAVAETRTTITMQFLERSTNPDLLTDNHKLSNKTTVDYSRSHSFTCAILKPREHQNKNKNPKRRKVNEQDYAQYY